MIAQSEAATLIGRRRSRLGFFDLGIVAEDAKIGYRPVEQCRKPRYIPCRRLTKAKYYVHQQAMDGLEAPRELGLRNRAES